MCPAAPALLRRGEAVAAWDGSTLGTGVLTAQGLAGPRQELIFLKAGCRHQTTELQI